MTNGTEEEDIEEGEVEAPPVPVAFTYPHLLPPNATKLERALASETGRLDGEVDGTIIDRLLQAYRCPADYLPWLAWHMSLSLWDWRWDEQKQRSVIARAVELNRMKGTAHAIRTYCDIMDSKAVQIMVPPQEFYIGKNLAKDEWDAWLHTMPEIRIKLIYGEGTASYDSFFIQDSSALNALQFEPPPVPNVHRAHLEPIGVLAIGQSAELVYTDLRHGIKFSYTPGPVIALPKEGSLGELQFGFIGEFSGNGNFFLDDEGPVLYGRRIIERVDGVDYPLQKVEKTYWYDEHETIEVERVYLPGKSTDGYFIDNDFVTQYATPATGAERYLDVQEIAPRIFTLRLDGTYVHERSTLGLTLLMPDLQPRSPRYERNSDTRPAGDYAYLGDFFMGLADELVLPPAGETEISQSSYVRTFIPHNRAGDMIADRIFLIDPTKPVPWMEGVSFVGVDRLGMKAFNAEVMVDLLSEEDNEMLFVDEGFVDQSFIAELDTSRIDRACYAIRASKAVRDRILVSFAPRRQLTPTDVLTPTMKAGDWVADRL